MEKSRKTSKEIETGIVRHSIVDILSAPSAFGGPVAKSLLRFQFEL